ncbi:MAG: tyrosine-type recombinase/integrase, partial [Nitrospiria bacterium]
LPGLRFHDLRHTFATRLVQAGVDLYSVQKLGRWKTVSMVIRYAHHHTESLRPGVAALDKIREESVTILSQSIKKG